MRCFMCLEYVPCSDGDTEKIKEPITTVHCAECHVEKLVKMCGEAEEREEREGWSFDDIIKEASERREAAEKRRAETGIIGLFKRNSLLRRKIRCSDSETRSNADSENFERNCFLCNEKFYFDSNLYIKHLEEKHMIIFGLKEIRKCGYEDGKQELIAQMKPKQAVSLYNPMVLRILVMHSKPHVL